MVHFILLVLITETYKKFMDVATTHFGLFMICAIKSLSVIGKGF